MSIESHGLHQAGPREQAHRYQDTRSDILPPDAVTSAVVGLLECAHRAVLRDAKEASRCIANATALLRAACNQWKEELPHPDSLPLAAWQLDRVLAFLDANLASALQVKDLAAAACLSVGHFSRVFPRTVGEPPLTYVRRRRIQRAQQLMLSTQKSLAEIAGECGFADQSHLTKLFRRMVGMPPAAWRRLRRASPHSSVPDSWGPEVLAVHFETP